MIHRRLFLRILGLSAASLPLPFSSSLLQYQKTELQDLSDRSVESEQYDYYVSNCCLNLPVDLASVWVSRNDDLVTVHWRTLTERDTPTFDIQHRDDSSKDNTWTSIDTVQGEGNSNTPQDYSREVGTFSAGRHWFRVQYRDLSGSVKASQPQAIFIRVDASIEFPPVAPNPVQGTAQIRFAVLESKDTSVAVYDLLGRRVSVLYQGTPPPNQTQRLAWNAASLPAGTYFLRITSGKHTRSQQVAIVR